MTATTTAPSPTTSPPANGGSAVPRSQRAARPPRRQRSVDDGPKAVLLGLLRRSRLTTTPRLLQVSLVVGAVAMMIFALTVNVSVTRNDSAVKTVGKDATTGITVAQRIKVNLAELDELVADDLLTRATVTSSGLPADYDAKRAELAANLVLAASAAPASPAYQQPLADLDYALAHYHALAKDSFADLAAGQAGQAATVYASAHDVMSHTLFPQADLFDKANTYVLNTTFDSHQSGAASSVQHIVIAFVTVLVVLALIQVMVAVRFRRLLNVALVLATVVALFNGFFAVDRLDASKSDLNVARDRAFDSVHQLARAGAVVVAIRQSEAQLLFDPFDGGASASEVRKEIATLFHTPGDVQGENLPGSAEIAANVPPGSGGFLAAALAADVSPAANQAIGDALRDVVSISLGDGQLRALVAAGRAADARAAFDSTGNFTSASSHLAQAQSIDQAIFDRFAGSADRATGHVNRVNLVSGILLLTLLLAGVGQRLREYRL